MFRQATTTHPLVRLFTISSRLSNNCIQKNSLCLFLSIWKRTSFEKEEKEKSKTQKTSQMNSRNSRPLISSRQVSRARLKVTPASARCCFLD